MRARSRGCAVVFTAAVCAASLGQSCVSPAVLPNSVDVQGTTPKPTATDSSAGSPSHPVEPLDFITGYAPEIGLAIDFAVARPDGSPDAAAVYTWDFGDAGTAGGTQVRHVYARPGTYVVRLCAAVDGENMCRERQVQVIVTKTIAGE